MVPTRFPTFLRSRTAGARRTRLYRSVRVGASLALLTALLVAAPALAAFRFGTTGNDVLVGTNGDDEINGRAGKDRLKGKAGNDAYYFVDNWDTDTLIETASGGTDTLNFRGVTSDKVTVYLTPEWVSVNSSSNSASGPGGVVRLAYKNANGETVQSIVENVVGGQGDGDTIYGGSGKNVSQPGGGDFDLLGDFGGHDDGAGGLPPIPVSNDVYKGFASNTGVDQIFDYGGQGDVLDMRPFETADVYFTPFDLDANGTEESLEIVTSPTTEVVVIGQFGEYLTFTTDFGHHGQIEAIIFADRTITDTSAARALVRASAEATSRKQARLAAAADGLAEEARRLLATVPEPGTLPGDGRKSDTQDRREKKR